jgi:5-methylcytosine-specific restriction endonuclease McrA
MPDRHGNFYQHAAWMKLRRQVRVENNFTCSRCGTQTFGRELHVHHRKPFAQAPALGLEKQNLVLLCRECHSKIESLERSPCYAVDEHGNPLSPNHPWFDQGAIDETS